MANDTSYPQFLHQTDCKPKKKQVMVGRWQNGSFGFIKWPKVYKQALIKPKKKEK